MPSGVLWNVGYVVLFRHNHKANAFDNVVQVNAFYTKTLAANKVHDTQKLKNFQGRAEDGHAAHIKQGCYLSLKEGIRPLDVALKSTGGFFQEPECTEH